MVWGEESEGRRKAPELTGKAVGQVPSLREQGTGGRHHEHEAVGREEGVSAGGCNLTARVSAQEGLLTPHYFQ